MGIINCSNYGAWWFKNFSNSTHLQYIALPSLDSSCVSRYTCSHSRMFALVKEYTINYTTHIIRRRAPRLFYHETQTWGEQSTAPGFFATSSLLSSQATLARSKYKSQSPKFCVKRKRIHRDTDGYILLISQFRNCKNRHNFVFINCCFRVII